LLPIQATALLVPGRLSIKRVFEIEPLLCPRCGGAMKIKSFITDPHQVKRLLDNLKLSGFVKPLPISGPAPLPNRPLRT
jgi:hypothetical protein